MAILLKSLSILLLLLLFSNSSVIHLHRLSSLTVDFVDFVDYLHRLSSLTSQTIFEMPSTKHYPLKLNLLFDDKTDSTQLRKIEKTKITLIVVV